MKRLSILIGFLALAHSAQGLTAATWTSAASGYWTNANNWQDGILPAAGIDASVNANGTYTNTVTTTGVVQNITLGTTSVSGTQTIFMSTAPNSWLVFSNMTVGGRGLFSYGNNSFMWGTGLVTVASGGQLVRNNGVANSGHFYEHDLTVDAGGRWTVVSGVQHQINSYGRDVIYTINGVLDGLGTVNLNNNVNRCWITGTGQVNVAQIKFDGSNGNLYLGGTLTVNGMVNQSNANSCAVILTNGTMLTLNGPYLMQQVGNAFMLFTNTAVATVTGTNLISIVHDGNGAAATLNGTKVGSGNGTLNIAGSGLLDICQASTAYSVLFGGGVINLLRNGHFWATTSAAAPIKQSNNGCTLNVSGSTLTLDTNVAVRFWRGSGSQLCVTNGGTLAMRQAVFEGNGSTSYELNIGNGTPGTLTLLDANTNTFRRSGDSSAVPSAPNLGVLLGTNAVVNPAIGSILRLQDCCFAIGMTNAAAWGWKTRGALEICPTNTMIEALNTDRGPKVKYADMSFGINELRLNAAGLNAVTTTVWNVGAPDNDADGTNDTALYVKTLNIAGLSGASAVLTNGTGVAVGKARIYYQTLTGGTVNQLGSGFVPLTPSGTTFFIR